MKKNNDDLKQLLLSFVHALEICNPIGHRNLTLVPLKGKTTEFDYILATDAIEDGTLTVKEINKSGDVNVLMVENKGNKRVLLLDGEELVGAKQNRIVNTTIIIEANTTQKIPVSCVEQGRWRSVSSKFTAGMCAPPEMRARKNKVVSHSYATCGDAVSDQGQVWADVESYVGSFNIHSPTRAMRDTIEQKRGDFNSYVNALPYPEGSRGVIAAVSGRFVSMDVLDQPKMFERIWERLVTGYAMDAARSREGRYMPFTEKSAKFFLDSVSDCTISEFKAVGLGRELRFESNLLLGQALVVDNNLVHMSVFPNTEHNRSADYDRYHIMPPSFRRRPRRDR